MPATSKTTIPTVTTFLDRQVHVRWIEAGAVRGAMVLVAGTTGSFTHKNSKAGRKVHYDLPNGGFQDVSRPGRLKRQANAKGTLLMAAH